MLVISINSLLPFFSKTFCLRMVKTRDCLIKTMSLIYHFHIFVEHTLKFVHCTLVNSLPNDKILDCTNLEAFAFGKFIMAKMVICVSDRVENFVGKGENAGYQHFLLFPQYFQKLYFSGLLKVGIVW